MTDKKENRILIVEDEESLSELLRINLETEGYRVDVARDGKQAMESFSKKSFHLILLDIMLPKMDGITVCRKIRAENRNVPILFLTAKNSSKDRIEGLRMGGDDYLGKPFELEELLLRVEKLLGRKGEAGRTALDRFEFEGNEVDLIAYEARSRQGERRKLTKREAMFLKFLFDARDRVVSREEVLETVWGFEVYPSTRTVDNFILAFRKFFEADPKHPRYFHSIRGVGYKFTPEGPDSADEEAKR